MASNPFSLEGKVALVTGANTGLGQGIALALAEAGADIAGAGIVPADETAEKVRALGRRFVNIEANLITIEPVERIVQEAVAGLGGLDILVNNAGLIRRADAVDFTEKDWDDVMNVNIKSAFFMSQAAGRHFIANGGGKIINIASMLSFQGGIRVPSYTASKSGIAGITRLLANEWASKNVNIKSAFFMSQAAGRHFIAQGSGKIINIASMLSFQGGIRVPSYTASKSGIAGITRLLANEWGAKGVNINAIAPGYMATDNTAQLRADEDRNKAILDRIPAGRWGEPSDLGGTAVFLASRASDYVNGAVIPVDGGWLAR